MTPEQIATLVGSPVLAAIVGWQVAKVRINGLASEVKALRQFRHEWAGKLMVLWEERERRKAG